MHHVRRGDESIIHADCYTPMVNFIRERPRKVTTAALDCRSCSGKGSGVTEVARRCKEGQKGRRIRYEEVGWTTKNDQGKACLGTSSSIFSIELSTHLGHVQGAWRWRVVNNTTCW